MPEKGWTTFTVRESTGKRIKELAKERGKTVDELINEAVLDKDRGDKLHHTKPSDVSLRSWSTCKVCRQRVKSENLASHMSRVHPKK